MEIKKSLAVLAGAGALLAFMPVATHAQAAATTGAASGPFADVPADHWAYTAVNTLQKAGIVIGYPDGTYGGRRAMTRYEFATAIARLLPLINANGNNDYATTGDLDALRTSLDNKLAKNQAALDALTRLVNEFQPELQQLGQNVAAVQARLANLEGRVAVLEAENQRFHVTGDINFIAEATNSSHKNAAGNYAPFYDKNGVLQGFTNGFGAGGTTVASHDLMNNADFYEDVLLHLTGQLSQTASAHVDLDFQNYISNIGNTARAGNPTDAFPGQTTPIGALTSGQYSAYVYQAYLETPIALGPLAGASIEIGRVGTQFTKWTMMQPNSDIYTSLEQTDDGNILVDGGKANFKIGPVGVGAFAGKFDTTPFSQMYVGTAINPALTNITGGNGATAINGPGSGIALGAGGQIGSHPEGTFTSLGGSINNAAPVNQGYGVRLTLGSAEGLVLGGTLEQFSVGNTFNGVNTAGYVDPGSGKVFNRVSVYGLDLNGGLPFALPGVKKGAITISGAYTVSAEGLNSGFNNVGNKGRYQSYDGMAGINLGKLNLQGGYEFVGPYFSAPGYWGKVGSWTNPTNVKGGVYKAKYPLTHSIALDADYEQYVAAYGNNSNGTLVTSPLQSKDHINRYQAGITYGVARNYAVDLGYENVQYDLRDANGTLLHAGKPIESYVTIGVGHNFNKNASFKLLYQIVHYNDKGTGFGAGANTGGDANYAGNVAVGQFSLKF